MEGKSRNQLALIYRNSLNQGRIQVILNSDKDANHPLARNVNELTQSNNHWIKMGREEDYILFLNSEGVVYAVNEEGICQLKLPPISTITKSGELLGVQSDIYLFLVPYQSIMLKTERSALIN